MKPLRSYPGTAAGEQPGAPPASHDAPSPKDARLLLQAGLWFLLAGFSALVLIEVAFGGIRHHGPHTNGGWLLLIFAMICLPLGIMASLLGGAKWLSNRKGRP